jgi:hypothetical protein
MVLQLFVIVVVAGVLSFGVAAILAPLLTMLDQSSSTTSAPPSASSATGSASKHSAASSTDAKIIDEMIAILKETKSEETFIVTVMALGRMGPEAKRALPQLIRNAERLKLFQVLLNAKAEAGDRGVSQHVAEAIVMMAAGQPMGYLSVQQTMACAHGSYGNPSAVGSWTQPAVAPTVVPTCQTPAAPCPVVSGPVVSPPVVTPGNVPTMAVSSPTPLEQEPSAPAPTPTPTARKASPKSSKSRTPATPLPSPSR